MLRQIFKDQAEFELYKEEQKIRQEKDYLTASERETLKKMLEKEYKPSFVKEEKIKLPIVTDIKKLKLLCEEVTKEDNIEEIVKKLKDTLACYEGLGLSAPQININKRIVYIKIPEMKERKVEYKELILINPKIIEHDKKFIFRKERCLSLPGLAIDTDRWIFITVEYQNEKLEKQTFLSQDIQGIYIQHEIDHLNGKLIIDRKHRAK